MSIKYILYAFGIGITALILQVFKISINLDLLKNVLIGLVAFTLILSPLVIVHEFAHFIVGKKLGAEPEVFSIGMGKKIWGFKWLGADFIVSVLPLGGYVRFKKVQFAGENGEGTTNETIAPWKWFFIAIAGPASNFILAFVVFWGLFMYGMSEIKVSKLNPETSIVVVKDQNSKVANILSVLSKSDKLTQVFEYSNKGLKPSVLTATEANAKDIPFIDKTTLSYSLSAKVMYHSTVVTIQALTKLVTNLKKNYNQVSSPIGIAEHVRVSYDGGWIYVVILFASLSYGLGFMNILPLSILDGGRCVMAIYQTVVSKNIHAKVLGALNGASVVLVLCLMLVGVFSDLMRHSGYNKEKVVVQDTKKDK